MHNLPYHCVWVAKGAATAERGEVHLVADGFGQVRFSPYLCRHKVWRGRTRAASSLTIMNGTPHPTASELSAAHHEAELQAAGVRVTAVRLLIWRTLHDEMTHAFSLADVQDRLYTIDKSTLFRALTLFAEHGLLHAIDDGSGMQKYCVCRCGDHVHHHGHVHLTCVRCHKTWCIEDVEIPSVPVPDDFEVTEREYVVKGICRKCRTGWR